MAAEPPGWYLRLCPSFAVPLSRSFRPQATFSTTIAIPGPIRVRIVPNMAARAASRPRPSSRGLGSRPQIAQDLELLLGGRLGGIELVCRLEIPARRLFCLLDGGHGVQRDEREFPRLGVGPQGAEVR